MLVFITYLLISGHIRGHGAGHLGHGGQYTDFGHAGGVALDEHELVAGVELVVGVAVVVLWVADGVVCGFSVATMMLGGKAATTPTRLSSLEVGTGAPGQPADVEQCQQAQIMYVVYCDHACQQQLQAPISSHRIQPGRLTPPSCPHAHPPSPLSMFISLCQALAAM